MTTPAAPELTYGSTFSVLGGGDRGLELAGWRPLWQVEADKWRREVILASHWPEVERFDDVRSFGIRDARRAQRSRSTAAHGSGLEGVERADGKGRRRPDGPDLIIGGFPCQDLSVAGRRAGLAGGRSGLFFEFARIVDEIRPRWILIENVPGLLSSESGRDMGAVVYTLGELGYGWAYRVVDSQYFGVPQGRRRVYIVGHSGGRFDRCGSVLFEPESRDGTPPPCGKAGQEIARTLGGGPTGARGHRDDLDTSTYVVSPSITKKWAKGSGGPAGDECQNLVLAHTIPADRRLRSDGHADNLRVTGALTVGGRDKGSGASVDNTPIVEIRDDAGALFAIEDYGGKQSGGPEVGLGVREGGPMFTLQANGHEHAVVAIQDARGSDKGQNGAGARISDVSYTLETVSQLGVARGRSVRRLTPRECERLQGFPDDWTNPTGHEKDGPRYAGLGDAMTVNVVYWIARRIALLEGLA